MDLTVYNFINWLYINWMTIEQLIDIRFVCFWLSK